MTSVKFLHLADSHIGRQHGSMSSVKGRNLMAIDAEHQFKLMMDMAVAERFDFVLHSGDLFDSSSISRSDMILNLTTFKFLPFRSSQPDVAIIRRVFEMLYPS